MSQPLSFYPVYDVTQGPRTKKLRFWLPLKHLFPDLIPSQHIIHKNVLVSAYYAMKVYRHSLREQLKMRDDVKLFMDSGGYQLMTKRFNVNPSEVTEILRYQEESGANVAATLDFPFRPNETSLWEGWRRIEITLKYAKIALENRKNSSTKLYAVIPGWDYLSIKKSAEILSRYDFDGFAMGAPEPSNFGMSSSTYLLKFGQMIYAVKKVIGDKPLHVFGISNIPSIYVLSTVGVSSFDSLRYMHSAKFREYILPNGLVAHVGKIQKGRHLSELPCTCPVCINTDANFLAKDGSIPGALLALHNLISINNYVKMINSAIKHRWFDELLKQGMKTFPSITPFFKWLSKQVQ
ncbi:MAG: tRNA-guanine transglycosylase [Nitrososphaeria archaeon]